MSSSKTKSEKLCQSLILAALVIAAGIGTVRAFIRQPDIAPSPSQETTQTGAKADTRPAPTIDGRPSPSGDSDLAPTEGAESAEEHGPNERKEGYWTFLLVGMDKGGGNTDTLIVVSYDVKNQKINMVSVPRDLRVDVSNRSIKKINAAYAYGKMDGLKEEIGRTLGIPIDVTVKVNLRGFAAVINAVGGVDFDVPCGMNYDDPYQDLSIHYRKGMQHLNGQQALEVCRFRQNNGGGGYGDEGRMQTQRAMLSTVAKKILSWNSLTKVNEFVQIFSDNVETNLSAGNLLWFATQAVNFNMEDLNTMSLPAEWINPYMYLDPDATLSLVNEYLNPYVQDRTADMLDIITR